MKQKVVIKISSMNDTRSRRKAMEIAVSLPGVMSVELQGDEKNQIAITGEGIDSTCLTVKIRKKVGYTEIVSVTPIPAAKKPDDKKPDDKKKQTVQQPSVYHPYPYLYQYETPPPTIGYVVSDDPSPYPCTIL